MQGDGDEVNTIPYIPGDSEDEQFDTAIDDTSDDSMIVMGKPLTTAFLQRYNPWGKMKREQLQSGNILSFNPKTTDVDECIDLINTLGDMVNQKEEAKKEKFIETMPTMIQTHLNMCKDWDTVKYTAKSLEHIIMKCDPPTPAMPMMATGATVPGLYSHIAHSVDKEEGDIPQPFKGAKPKQTRGRGKPKGKPQDQRRNPPKIQEVDETYNYESPNNYYHNTSSQSRGCRPYNGQSGNRQFRGFVPQNRGQRPQYSQHQFQNYRYQRSAPQKIVHNMVTHVSHIFKGTNRMHIEAEAGVGVLSNSEDAATAGRTSRIMLEHISINITHMTSNQNSMAHHVVCVEDLTIPQALL